MQSWNKVSARKMLRSKAQEREVKTEVGKEGQTGRQCESAHMAAVTTRRSLAAAKRFVGFSAKPHFGRKSEERQ